MVYIGIDPGLTGAVAAIYEDGKILLYDTPTIEIKVNNKKKQDYIPSEMADILRDCSLTECQVFLERISARPGQGVTSMFGFGKGYGIWIGILSALEIPYTLVTPQAWKKEIMKCKSDKDAARLRAHQLFPQAVDRLNRKKDIGRADALLLAEYCRRVSK